MSQELITYASDSPEVEQDRLAGWALFARASAKVDSLLEGHALALQGILAEDTPMPERIAAYKREHEALVTSRMGFTALTDALKEQKMATEKQYSPKTYAPFIDLVAAELKERTTKAASQQAAINKTSEANRLRAHTVNEYTRMVTEYTLKQRGLIHECYTHCLAAKTPPDAVQNAIDICIAAMSETQPGTYQHIQTPLHTQEELQAIWSTIPTPEWNQIWAGLVAELVQKFELYDNDLANAEAAIQAEEIEHASSIREVSEAASQEMAVNTLVASADVFVQDAVVVKEKRQIVLKDEPAFVVAILSAFLQHAQKCLPKVRVKKLSNLTIAQMATALTDVDVTVSGIEYEVIQK